MEIESFIKKMKEASQSLIDFIEAIEDSGEKFIKLKNFFRKQEILQNKNEIRLLFQFLSKIADSHHRSSDFFNKLEIIFQYLIKDTSTPISDFIPDYNNYNQQIIFLLLDKKFVKPDESFLNHYLQNELNNKNGEFQSTYYLYPVLIFCAKYQKQIESEILGKYEDNLSKFKEKCQKGENDSYICSLLREDSVEEFIAYVNRTNLSLCTKIEPSIYETNPFLIGKVPTLIEYAAFFGSIQIIQYLKYNNVPLNFSLWLYAIHSNNPDLIHFLEENEVKKEEERSKIESKYSWFNKKKELFNDVLVESIKRHHNDISNYIKDNLFEDIKANDQTQFNDNYGFVIIDSLNFHFFPDDITSIISRSLTKKKGFDLSELCFSLRAITIPSSVTSIGDYAFDGCSSLTQITFEIPSSANSIGNYAFNGCSSLTQIAIPSSITSIGHHTFNECVSLKQITIPSSVTSVGNQVFSGMVEIEIKGNIKKIHNKLFSGCSSLTQITIPSSVTSIGISAFNGCSSLTQITIPSSITSIEESVFYGCLSLTQITIPSSVTSISNSAFYGCSRLSQITIPSSITSIEDYAFAGCSSLTQVTIPSSVTSIGNSAFSGCSSLTQITIPSSITSIEDYAFSGCSSLAQITIPSSATSIGNSAFSGCSRLTQITIPSSATSIRNGVFYGCSRLIQITIPSSVTSIGESAFSLCSSLTQITIPSSVTSIGKGVFHGCSRLTQITIPSSVTSISNSAFYGCSRLTQITIPSSVTSIEDYAFNGCSSLTKITIPSSVISIGNFAFDGCSSLSPDLMQSISNIQSNNRK